MRIAPLTLLLAVTVAVGACAGDEATEPAPKTTATPHVDREVLLGFLWEPGPDVRLARLDPLTLAPTSTAIAVPANAVTALSPAGDVLALGAGEVPRIDLLDLDTLRPLGRVELPVPGYVSRLSWTPEGTLFAAVGESTVVVVNAEARQVVETRQVDGVLIGTHAVRAGLLGLVAPADRIAPLDVVVFGGKGMTRASLEIVGGWERLDSGEHDYRARSDQPGFAVAPDGTRAVVVPARGRVAEIDLNTLEVTYHELSRPVSLLDRLRNWVEPAAHAKEIEGPFRHAVWLDSNVVAVTGVDYRVETDENGEPIVHADPAGLSFIDTSDWSVRSVNAAVAEMRVAGDILLGLEPGCGDKGESYGLVAYDLDGSERFDLCREEGFDLQVSGDYAYLGFRDNTRFEIVDVTTGKIVARPKTAKTTSLLQDF